MKNIWHQGTPTSQEEGNVRFSLLRPYLWKSCHLGEAESRREGRKGTFLTLAGKKRREREGLFSYLFGGGCVWGGVLLTIMLSQLEHKESQLKTPWASEEGDLQFQERFKGQGMTGKEGGLEL